MIRLSKQRLHEELSKIRGVSFIHTKSHTIASRDDYAIYICNIKNNEKAPSHKLLWDESRHYAPLYPAHLVFRLEVSQALGRADYE